MPNNYTVFVNVIVGLAAFVVFRNLKSVHATKIGLPFLSIHCKNCIKVNKSTGRIFAALLLIFKVFDVYDLYIFKVFDVYDLYISSIFV
jgi:hypothetical protein